MAKKKVPANRKGKTGKPAGKSKPAKKKVAKKKVVRRSTPKLNRLWTQVPGTFTYKYTEPTTQITFICHAKGAMDDAELDEQIAAYCFIHLPAPNSQVVEFQASETVIEDMRRIIMSPTLQWVSKLKAFLGADSVHVDEASFPTRPQPKRKRLPGSCSHCGGCGWVCENHATLPMERRPGGCTCGAPGMPCPTCNPKGNIILGPGDFAISAPACKDCGGEFWINSKQPCSSCNPDGKIKKGSMKIIRTGLN